VAIPVWTVGEVLSASDVNSWFVPVVVFKAADEGPITTTTLQNDNELILPVTTGASYLLDGGGAETCRESRVRGAPGWLREGEGR